MNPRREDRACVNRSRGMRVSALLLSLAVCHAFGQAPTVNAGGALNASTGTAPVTQGSLVAIYGTGLASQIAVAASIPLSMALNNVTVTFNGEPAPLSFVSPNQINAQLPWDVLNGGTGTANVVVTNNGAASAPTPVVVGAASPAVYATAAPGLHAIAVDFTTGLLAAPVGSIPGLTTAPAKVGDILIVYATGLGAVSAPPPNGGIPTTTVTTTATPTVLIGGVPANLLFSGLSTFVGAYQLNVMVPQVASGSAVPIQIQLGGITSPNTTTIAVQ
jgi:uncharacterized protein (TIGR03437 family)